MKKIVGIVAAAALATSAFAEINIGSWNRGVFAPVAYDGDKVLSVEGPSWDVGSTGGVRTGLGFSASSENAGMVFDIHGNPGASIAMGDNAYTWVKPVDMLTVKFGKMDNNWGRLDHCFGTWDGWRFKNSVTRGEGIGGVERQKGLGAEVTLQPVEGLVIDYEANFTGDNHAYDVLWESSSTMIGYQADFGFVRAIINGQQAQKYKNKADEDTKPAAIIGLAADITAVENLTLKVGASYPTNLTGYSETASKKVYYLDTESGTVKSNDTDPSISYPTIKAAVGADYALDVATIHAQVNLDVLPKKFKAEEVELGNIGLNIGAGVDYKINDALTAIADVRFQTYTALEADGTDGSQKLSNPAFGAFVGLQQNLSNASFAFGAQFGKRVLPENEDGDFTFAVPLTMTVSF